MSSDMSMGLNVDLTANADSVVSAAQQGGDAIKGFEGVSESAMASLTAALEKLNLNFDGLTKVSRASGDAVETFAGKSGLAARALDAMGSEAGAAAARIEGFAGSLERMGEMVPEIAAIGAAIATVTAALSFWKDGIDEAQRMQQVLDGLHATVDSFGGAWGAAKDEIEQFITSESRASGVARDELASALQLVASETHNLADAETIVRIAEEAHIATGRSLTEVISLITHAEGARANGLLQLDPRLKSVIADHGHLSEILKVLHQDFGHAIDDQDNAALAAARMHEQYSLAAEALGQKMQPALTNFYYGLAVLPGAISNVVSGLLQLVHTLMDSVVFAVTYVAEAFYNIASAINLAAHGRFNEAKYQINDFENTSRVAKATSEDFASALHNLTIPAVNEYAQSLAKAKQAHDAMNTSMQFDPTVGMTHAHSGSGHSGHAAHAKAVDLVKQQNDEISKKIQWLEKLRAANQLTDEQEIDGLIRIENEYQTTAAQRATIEAKITEIQKREQSEQKAADDKLIAGYRENLNKRLEDVKKANGEHTDAFRKELSDEIGLLETWIAAHKNADKAVLDAFKQMLADRKAQQTSDWDWQVKQAEEQQKKAQEAAQKHYEEMAKLADKYTTQVMNIFDGFFKKGTNGFQSFADAFKKMLEDMFHAWASSEIKNIILRMMGVGGNPSAPSSNPMAGLGNYAYNGVSGPQSAGGPSSFLSFLGLAQGSGGAPSSNPMYDPSGTGMYIPTSAGRSGMPSSLASADMTSANEWAAAIYLNQVIGHGIGEMYGGGSHDAWAQAGAFIGGIPGALLFGLIGHSDNKANMPDKYLPGYQQWLSAYNNGLPTDGGHTLEKYLKGINPAMLSGQALQDYNTLAALAGPSNDLGIAGEKDDVFTFGSGNKMRVEDYMALANRALTEFQNYPIMTTSDMFMSSNGISLQTGSYTQSGYPFYHDFPDYAGAATVPYSPSIPSNGGGGGGGVSYPTGGGGVSKFPVNTNVVNVYGNVLTENQLYNNTNAAIASNSRSGTARRFNVPGKI